VDNLCHTLAGAALAESGLRRRTALGTATLLIGANLPDIDVLAYFGGPLGDLEFRRGWTHGVVALVILPLLLTGAMLAFDRLARGARRAVLPTQVRAGPLLLLSALAVLSHPILDSLNTYGVRWLMPWTGARVYGDTLFIIDPWVWLMLGAGVWASRRRRHARLRTVVPERPARLALFAAAAYVVAMATSNVAARRIVTAEAPALFGGGAIEAMMVAPVAANPFRREVVLTQRGAHGAAAFHWLRRPHLDAGSVERFPRLVLDDRATAAAAATVAGRRFLGWARFPTATVDSSGPSPVVHFIDVRYARRPGVRFGSVSIPATPAPPETLP
jgi:inner membrane protein